MKWELFLFFILIIHPGQFLTAQETAVLLPEFSYSYGFPAGDLDQRYGSHLCLGVGFTYQPAKNHFQFGTKFSYFFGSEVKEDVLLPFRTNFEGLLIGRDHYLTEMKLKERGYIIQLHTGGLIPVFSQRTARQSFKWQLGVGFIEHHIRFVDDAKALNQFTTDYLNGIDRLCNGWAMIPFAGYEFLSRKSWLSFYAGVESVFAFTQNRRSLNYDTNQSELGISRNDILVNFKLGIYLPFYLGHDYEKIEY